MADEITCPYCNHRYENSWEYGVTEDPDDMVCEECGRTFRVWVEIEPIYYCEEKR